MKINLTETHQKRFISEGIDLSALDPELLEIPSREPLYNGRKEMPGRITCISFKRTLDFVHPEYSEETLIFVETTRVRKNGALSAIRPETHRFSRRTLTWARPYWADRGYSFTPLVEALSEQIDEFDKLVSEQ